MTDLTKARALVAAMELPEAALANASWGSGEIAYYYTADQLRECMAQALVRNWPQGQAVAATSGKSRSRFDRGNVMAIEIDDIVDVRTGGGALVSQAKVLHVPVATGDAWGFRTPSTGMEIWTTEPITIYKDAHP